MHKTFLSGSPLSLVGSEKPCSPSIGGTPAAVSSHAVVVDQLQHYHTIFLLTVQARIQIHIYEEKCEGFLIGFVVVSGARGHLKKHGRQLSFYCI